ncbi:MAG: glutathione S-transferase [Methylocystaceae bacterium]|nr:glutathione S-transferase [Methylocystaceae bacterium]
MTDPVLYSFRRCPYAMRARMALFASGCCVEVREVVLRDKPQQMVALSPKATVPVLQLPDGQVLDESLDIMHWALVQNDPQDWLTATSDETDDLIAYNDQVFKDHLDGYKYAARYENVDPLEQRVKGEIFLKRLDACLSTHTYLCADRPTLADYAIFPFIRQFAFVDMDWFQQTPYPLLINWLMMLLESETFKSVMIKYAQWQEGDAPVYL